MLDILVEESQSKILFFDEIQIIQGWEVYVRGKLDQGYKVIITGSNASLLSRELGTKLTGSNLPKALFPFYYAEFCAFQKLPKNYESSMDYLNIGGFAQYIQLKNEEFLYALINDLLYRDIAVRHNIRDIKSLKNL